MHIHIHHHIELPAEVMERLDVLLRKADLIIRNQEKFMPTLDQILTDVADESTQIDSLSTLTAGIKQQLADALAGTTLPTAVQAKIDAVFAGVEANKGKVVAAINANTTAAAQPPATPPPAPPAP